MAEHFEKLCSFQFLERLKVEKNKSKRTGITLCFVEVPGPLVNGFFTLGMALKLSFRLKLRYKFVQTCVYCFVVSIVPLYFHITLVLDGHLFAIISYLTLNILQNKLNFALYLSKCILFSTY